MTNVKLTKGSQKVIEILENLHELSSAQDIHSIMRKSEPDSPGLTTVYRSLESLVSHGLVQSVDLGDGERRYELISPGEHHHHLVCSECNKSLHLDQCLVEDLEKTIKTKYGFETKSHVLEFFGVCKNCRKVSSKKKL